MKITSKVTVSRYTLKPKCGRRDGCQRGHEHCGVCWKWTGSSPKGRNSLNMRRTYGSTCTDESANTSREKDKHDDSRLVCLGKSLSEYGFSPNPRIDLSRVYAFAAFGPTIFPTTPPESPSKGSGVVVPDIKELFSEYKMLQRRALLMDESASNESNSVDWLHLLPFAKFAKAELVRCYMKSEFSIDVQNDGEPG